MKNIFIFLLLSIIYDLRASDSLIFIIRVDDIQSRNTSYVPKSIKDFQNTVQARGGKVTWAVIPHRIIESQSLDGVLIKELKESANFGHEIVLHGYNHICPICQSTGHEMYCATRNQAVTYLQQKQLIQDGMKLLKDSINIVPKLFVPPGHSCDSTTYKVLVDIGINRISLSSPLTGNINPDLFNIKVHNEYTWSMTSSNYQTQLKSALNDIKSIGNSFGYYCLLFHDPFIRQGYQNGIAINWTGELLDSLKVFYNNKIKFMTLSEAANYFQNTPVNVKNELDNTQKGFYLSQNYPNPFNPETKISVTIENKCNISIRVFDIMGKQIAVIFDGYLDKGNHPFSIKGNNWPAGVYFYRLIKDNQLITKKMVLIK